LSLVIAPVNAAAW